MRTMGQLRAANALAGVEELSSQGDDFKSLYRSYVDRLGPAIVMNGLGQALATERAAAGSRPGNARERAHLRLYENVQRWLCRDDGGIYPAGTDLLKSISAGDESLYLVAQAEALAWLEWHKKFCRASFRAGAEE